MRKAILFISAVLLIANSFLGQKVKAGQECFPEKNNELLVYDVAQLLSNSERIQLENKLDEFARATSNQIAVIIVPDLCGMEKAQFAIELGEKWGIGQKKDDNGIVVLIKPKTPSEKGKVFIAVGRGLEGAIPDAKAFLIVENEMKPRFIEGKMYEGIDAATNVIMQLAKGEYNFTSYENDSKKGGGKTNW
ncbi:MAG: TPM domain-containing protein, partial [Flavobacteriales bacterium]